MLGPDACPNSCLPEYIHTQNQSVAEAASITAPNVATTTIRMDHQTHFRCAMLALVFCLMEAKKLAHVWSHPWLSRKTESHCLNQPRVPCLPWQQETDMLLATVAASRC